MEETWRIELFGGLRAVRGGREISRFRTKKTAALLGYLALHADRAHAREDLISLFWPSHSAAAARNNLSKAVSSLRRQLEPPGVAEGSVLVADRGSVRLNPLGATTDVSDLKAALRRASEVAGQERLYALERGCALFRGELLEGTKDEPWLEPQRERLRSAFSRAARELAIELERGGAVGRALEQLRRAVAASPLDEAAHRDLMALLARSGQPLAAARHYQELVRTLKREVSRLPSAETRELARRLEQLPARPAEERPAVPPRTPAPSEARGRTVTFLVASFTGLDGAALVAQNRGELVSSGASEHVAAFARPADALACARSAVRAALDTCELEAAAPLEDPRALERVRRFFVAARPGHVLCTEPTAALLARQGEKPEDLGIFALDGASPERVHALRDGAAEPLAAERAAVPGLPLDLTRFFGRTRELEAIRRELAPQLREGTRLLTLLGPGGMGKTRLAVEALRALVEPFRGAAWFVPLAGLTAADAIPSAVVESLRLPPAARPEPLERAVLELARRPSLLVLDNMEHLVEGGSALVRTILERAPETRVLVTSRRRLGIEGERELAVEPLEAPEDATDLAGLAALPSVALFVDRAQAVRPDFQITRNNAASIATLVRRLEGIPLALSLAGGRAQVLFPEQILQRLDERLDLLRGGARGADRHRTLRAAIEWSHNLLVPGERRFFAALGVFQGSFTAEAAAEVCGEKGVLDHLSELCGASLLVAGEKAGEPRFRMLDTLRAFAREQLAPDERAALEERHARFFLARAGAASAGLAGPEQAEWLERVAPEADDVRAALAWSAADSARADVGLGICAGFWRFWAMRGLEEEGFRHCVDALAWSRTRSTLRVDALLGATTLSSRQGNSDAARPLGEEALELARELGDRVREARALAHLGNVETLAERLEVARAHHMAALEAARALDDRRLVASARGSLGHLLLVLGRFSEARPLLDESLAAFEKTYPMGHVLVLTWLGKALLEQGELERARRLVERSIEDAKALGFEGGWIRGTCVLAELAEREGHEAEARALFQQSYEDARRAELGFDVALAATGLARLHPSGGEEAMAILEDGLGEARADGGVALLASGHIYFERGELSRRSGDLEEARAAYEESLSYLVPAGERSRATACVARLAELALDAGRAELAARLLGAVAASRTALGVVADSERLLELRRAAERALRARFERSWARGAGLGLEAAIALAVETPPLAIRRAAQRPRKARLT